MGIHAFMRRDEPFWTCCRTCGNRDGDRCTQWNEDIRWPRDWYGCGSYTADNEPYPTQTLLEGWR